MSAVGDKLRARRNIDPNRVNETELEVIDDEIAGTEETYISVADKYHTRDSVPLIKFMRLVTEYIAESTTPAEARAQLKRFENGEIAFIQIGGNTAELEAELAMEKAKREEAERNLKLMQETATGSGPKGLGAGSPTESIMEEIKAQVSGDPERAKNLLLLFKQLSGLDPKEYEARADVMGRVAFASPDWNLVPAPGTGEMLPSILVAADLKVADLTKKVDTLTDDLNPLNSGSTAHRLAVTEKALTDEQNTALAGSLAHQLAAAEEELDPANTGSIGCRAGWYDYNVDPANTNGWAGKLAAIQQELTNEQNDKLATSLAGKLKQAEDDVRAAKKEKDDADKVLAPISKAAKAADTAMDRALAKLADNSFGWKRLVPQNVKDARDQIDAAKLALHQAQNPKTAP